MAPPSTALTVRNVSKTYRRGDTDIRTLDDINLTVDTGEIIAVLGPSGSGRTTLCSIAGSILSPSSGHITVGHQDITGLSTRDLAASRPTSIGFVFQTVNLVPFLTARENLLVIDEMGLRSRAAARRADPLLEEVRLADREANLPSQLSGGQRPGRHRTGTDERTNTRPVRRAHVRTRQRPRAPGHGAHPTEMKNPGTTAIIVTQNQRVTRFANRTVHINDGRLDNGPPRHAP